MTDATDQSDAQQRRPIVELLSLALPTVAQSVSYTIMMFVDTWMLSRLGTDAPTAAGNAGMWMFAIVCFGFGTLLVVNTLVSQSFGRGEFDHCGRYLWQGIWVATAYSVLVLPLIPLAPRVFHLLGHADHLAQLEARYLQVALLSTLFKMVATAAGQFLLATNRPNSVLLSAVIGVSANIAVAAVLIFGALGMPRLGVVGAAWAANVGVFVEMCVLLLFVFPADRGRFNVRDWRLRWREATTLLRVGASSGLQIVADVLAWTLFANFVIAQISEPAMAANQFMFRYLIVSFMPAIGISQAVTALVGRYIGMKRFDVAMQRADLGFKLASVYMIICGVLFVVFRYPLIHVFTDDPDVARIGATLLIFAGVYQLFDAMYLVYNGALRGAGDTFVPAVATATLCWGVTVFGGYMIAHYFPSLGVVGPWTVCTIYGLILGVFIMARFRRGAWKSIHLETPANSNVTVNSAKLSVLTES
jgi:MATE family multidrug resistance protein